MRSTAPFRSMPMRVSSMSADFEHSVLASRLNSWQRKSNLRPTGLSGRASASRRPRLGDMGGQPVELLAHVGLADQQRHLLGEALLRQAAARAPAARRAGSSKRARNGADLRRGPLGGALAQAFDLDDVAVDHPGQRLALGGARRGQRLQHLVQRGRERPVERGHRLFALRALVLLLDDAAHAQQPVGRRRRRAGALAHLLDQDGELGQQRAVDAQRLALLLAGDGERERDVAALQMGADGVARRIFQAVEALRHPAADLEIAAVDAARFPDPAPPLIRSLRPGVSRHACDQKFNSTAAPLAAPRRGTLVSAPSAYNAARRKVIP